MKATVKKFRPNVCAVIGDETLTRVLLFRRVEATIDPHYWQFPQGGLEKGEDSLAGLMRELEEEIGTRDAEVLKRAAHPIRYEFPPEIMDWMATHHPDKSDYHGQEQQWFLLRLRGGTEAIHFHHQPAEFDAFRWATPAEAVELVVPFKREAYREGLRALALLASE